MKHEQQMVRDWMSRFGQETPTKTVIPSLEIRKLRAKLILEETLETLEGLGVSEYGGHDKPDLVAIADGIADSLVVLLGTAVACGIDIKPVFDEVMRSNDSKLWTEKEFKEQTEEFKDSVHSTLICPNIGHCILVKDKDGKVIKSPSYSPANIAPLLSL